jgi:zinc transporter ZupT
LLCNQSLETRLILIALASGFLITLVTQGMIPEANREGEPSFSGILYMGGLSLYALMSFTLRWADLSIVLDSSQIISERSF